MRTLAYTSPPPECPFSHEQLLTKLRCFFLNRRPSGRESKKNIDTRLQSGLHLACDQPMKLMPVAQLTLEIRIEHAHSLKERRQVVRSLKDQLRQGFNISVAELDEAVTWQSATIGVVALSRSRDYLHGLVEEVERAARRILNENGAELADSFWEYIES
jgi:hypothetical protein